MWTYIKTQFKMSKDLTTSEIENMTLDKFLGTALADIFSGKEIKSPMVGTFYGAPNPGADTFVKVGDSVKEGEVLCIIEAMKMMNEVKADFGGTIVEIIPEDAEPVEFGQTLVLLK